MLVSTYFCAFIVVHFYILVVLNLICLHIFLNVYLRFLYPPMFPQIVCGLNNILLLIVKLKIPVTI